MNTENVHSRPLIRILAWGGEWGISIAICVMLWRHADPGQVSGSLSVAQLNPGMLSVGFLLCGVSVALALWRWQMLLKALGVRATTRRIANVGLFSYALNLLALGSFGGDLGRAVLLTRNRSERQNAAVSVVLDRGVGLYAMFLISFLLLGVYSGFGDSSNIPTLLWAIAGGGTIGIPIAICSLVMSSNTVRAPHVWALVRLREFVCTLAETIRGRTRDVVRALGGSMVIRVSTAVGLYFFGRALNPGGPDLLSHLLVVSLALLTGCLPLPMNGLGAFEASLEYLFHVLSDSAVPPGYGLMLALTYRVFLVGTGILGGLLFFTAAAQPERIRRPAVVAAGSSIAAT